MMDLSYFQDSDGNLRPIYQQGSRDKVQAMISGGRPARGILAHAAIAAEYEQWQWLARYNQWLEDSDQITEEAALIVRATDESGQFLGDDTETASTNEAWAGGVSPTEHLATIAPEPVRPTLQTPEELLTQLGYYTTKFNRDRQEAYPDIANYIDAKVKQASSDALIVAEGVAQEAQHLADCLQVKIDIPKPS